MHPLEARRIDFTADDGVALLRQLKDDHGAALARAATLPERLFSLRSPWAPGLSFIGGEIVSPIGAHERFSLAGASDTPAGALVACIGEGVERISQVEHDSDVAARSTLSEAASSTPAGLRAAIESLAHAADIDRSAPIDWMAGRVLGTGEPTLVPADWCVRRPRFGPFRIPGAALSTGCAAGATIAAASLRAVLELVERDAAALWWRGGRRGRPMTADAPALLEAFMLTRAIRQGRVDRVTWLLDITSDVAIPTVAAVSVNRAGTGFVFGLAARLSASEAARAALLEMAQMELARIVVAVKRQQGGETALNATDRHHLELGAVIDATRCDLIHPSGVPILHAATTAAGDAEALDMATSALSAVGIEVALVDLPRAAIGIPVVKAIAPRLQLMPATFVGDRLDAAITACGGGSRWTGSCALL